MSQTKNNIYFIVCRNCTNNRTFEMVLQANNRKFSIKCGNCGEHVRTLPSYLMREYLEPKFRNMAFPMGKYKGVLICSMVKKEDISFLLWYQRSDWWNTAEDNLKKCINFHLENYKWMLKDGLLPDNDSERPDSVTKKYPLDLLEKKKLDDDLPI